MNYKKIAELSQGILDYENAIEHISDLAKTLLSNKGDIDLEIMIREAIKPKINDGRNNAGHGIELEQVSETIFKMNTPTQYQSPTHTAKGLKQNGMPNSVGLIILDKVKNWYVEGCELLKKELNDELRMPEKIMLTIDYKKLDVGIRHQFEG